MTYTPKRDARFEYLWDVMSFIEDNQCRTCVYSKLVTDPENVAHAEEYPMCYEIESELVAEGPVESLDDHGGDGVVCVEYKEVTNEGRHRN